MRSGLLLCMVAAMIAAGCRSVSDQTADSAAVEPAVFSCAESALASALAAFLQGRLIEEELGQGTSAALPYYRTVAERAPGSHTVYARIALEALHRADLPAAVQAMEASYQACTNDPRRQIDLAAMYQLDQRPEEAAGLFAQALAAEPTNTTVYLALSDIYFASGEDTQATALLDTAFEKVPDPAPLLAYLYQQGHTFTRLGALDRAIGCFEVLARRHPTEQADILYLIAELQVAQQQPEAAVQTLRQAIEHPDAPAPAFMRLSAILLAQHLPEQALEILQKGWAQHPGQASLAFALGSAYSETGQHEQALQAYEAAVSLMDQSPAPANAPRDPARLHMLIALAYSQERLQRYEDAADTLQTALEAFPESHVAMNFLAYMWAEQDQHLEDAYILSKRSLAIEPGNGAYLDTLGWIYYRKGELHKALQYLEQARAELGDDPEISLHFGDVYAAQGNQAQAIHYWQQSLQAAPTPRNRAWQQLEQAGLDPEAWLSGKHGTPQTTPEPDMPAKILPPPADEASPPAATNHPPASQTCKPATQPKEP